VVAVSGGPDSMALLHTLALLRPQAGHELFAHGVDHGLRETAAAELDVAQAFAESLDVPFSRSRVTLGCGGNLQARARAARHDALQGAAAAMSATFLATGHHADDRAETVLLRMLRGSGPRGIAVLPAMSRTTNAELDPARPFATLIRPLLRARRRDVSSHIARHNLPFATDPSNDDPRYARARVRNELLPLLETLNPAIVTHLCSLSDQVLELVANSPAPSGAPKEGPNSPAYTSSLPRSTQLALAALAHFPKKNASVELPRGLVATFDRDKHKIVVLPKNEASGAHSALWPAWKHREGNGRHHNER
jgi:tRNA(Ile)-lysidine synthase